MNIKGGFRCGGVWWAWMVDMATTDWTMVDKRTTIMSKMTTYDGINNQPGSAGDMNSGGRGF
jgi:hypothetical protein